PAATQRLDQRHARRQAAAEYVERGTLVRQCRRLNDDYRQIIDGAGAILIGDNRQRLARRLNSLALDRRFLLENAQRGQIVFDFLKTSEHSLPVGRHILVVSGNRLRGLRSAQTGVEYGLRERRPQ